MVPKDLRGFLKAIEASGDLLTIEQEVDWDLELCAFGRLACERDAPAMLFRNVKDYGPDWPVFLNPIATWRRLAVALGLPPDTPVPELYRAYAEREQNLTPPRIVTDAPCKESIIAGDKVDLFELPAPMVHEGDGGRYLGTWDLVVSKDPATGWVNWGIYRFMVHNERLLTGFPRPTSHLGKMFLDHYVPERRPMPIAIAIGCDLPSHLAAAATFKLGGNEAELAGGLGERPAELVKCETSDLFVPASAEIVVEAEVLPDRIAQEGPYGEYPGYRTGEMGHSICARVTAITHRRRPIFTVDVTGLKDCSSIVTSISGAIAIQRRLEKHGVPVAAVYVPPEGAVHLAIVSVRRGGGEVAERALETLTARRALLSKIIVVDEDVDVFNLAAVLHAFSTKCHPGTGIHVTRYKGRANTLTPCYSQAERVARSGATAAFDATWPPEWPREIIPVRATFDSSFPSDVQQRVLDRWKALGL
ncbi:MAG TPA: UbiD family decarboxylase [Candidatus Acidoferrales bacterium]|nr:UbiD family decarboxylase [Candidatus Acidoferrales bacterium]